MRPSRATSAVACLWLSAATPAVAQEAPPASRAAVQSVTMEVRAEATDEASPIVFFNRHIVSLRARVIGRAPVDRAEMAMRVLDDLAARGVTGPVEARPFEAGFIISVQGRGVMALTPPDLEGVAGETLDATAASVVERVRAALLDSVRAREPGVLLRATVMAAAGIVTALLALWGVTWLQGFVNRRFAAAAERTLTRSGIADVSVLRASRVLDIERHLLTAVTAIVDLVIVYTVVGFVLRRFAYTRPWGDSMRGFLVSTLQDLGLGMANAMPGLVTAAIVFVIARFLTRLIRFWFVAVERGRLAPRWIHPETAQPTRRLLTALVWIFAVVVAYPYLPGSQTDAFRGVSVFLGLLVTFGSSGLVNQIMSGFMVTYSRALRVGDFVRIGDVEGTVMHLGILSTKVKTVWREEVTIPNAVVVSTTTTDYSRGEKDGVMTLTSVTIGYDAPWRQVQSLLLQAAQRTPGLRRDVAPFVLQTALQDFYVKYTLLVCLERQEARPEVLHALHANIQDLFNEYGVQIMSPNYLGDPAAPKIVAKKDWFAAPAPAEDRRSAS